MSNRLRTPKRHSSFSCSFALNSAFNVHQLGAPVETLLYDSFDHNAPLISLASPWRGSRDVDDAVIAFVQRHTEVSVPVQAQTP